MSNKIFELTLHTTYYEKGFFNVTVAHDRQVKRAEGPIQLVLGDSGEKLQAKVDRSTNQNKTPRIIGGLALARWFQANFKLKDTVHVDLTSFNEIRLSKPLAEDVC